MSTDPTEPQRGSERRQSREMSLKPGQPPTQVPGYDPERFLGVGAYGEVWVARARNTGRRVAIKFYAHRSGLDWSLLSREVEKLAFLFADRYVVQLLGVGWDAEPPYYIMEYLERGSLAERLQQGPIPVGQAGELFRDGAIGLVHAHGKGVLHCDLKPANILLDQDNKPRMADFGQSRLSTEQVPALGTLFYMAPEQADLEAAPDARWDVYALGALLYCMLTGGPPHRTGEAVRQFEETPHLVQRLNRYRRLIENSPPPAAHREVRGVDRALAEIVDRCLAVDPEERFPNAQAVLDALDDRAASRARRPMMVLGAVGPALLLLVVAVFAWWGFGKALEESDNALTRRALESNRFAAQFAAQTALHRLDERYRAVEQVASSAELREALAQIAGEAPSGSGRDSAADATGIRELLLKLSDPNRDQKELESLRKQFRDHSQRKPLQDVLDKVIPEGMRSPEVAGWFVTDRRGVQVARVPERPAEGHPKYATIGTCFAWRSYVTGERDDLEESARPGKHIGGTTLSAVFRSQATQHWMVAVSHPIYGPGGEEDFLGVAALMVDLGGFVELKESGERQLAQFAVLVDWRKGKNEGVILQHPRFRKLRREGKQLPGHFQDLRYRVLPENLPRYEDFLESPAQRDAYHDPFYSESDNGGYEEDWLVCWEKIPVNGPEDVWGVIVQEAHHSTIGSTLERLQMSLIRYGLMALATIALVIVCLWSFVIRSLRAPR